MSRVKTTSIVGWVTAIALVATSAFAQTPANRKTYFTFSTPVSLPGVTLPAGTYTFRLADVLGNRHIVQVLDRDEQKLYRTLLAIPAERAEAEGDPVIMFREAPATMAPPVRYWYYAGEKMGNEFVYSREQAQLIANASRESVMATPAEVATEEEMKTAEISRVEPETTAGQAEAATRAETQPQAPATAEPAPRGTAGELPRTASPLPLVGLLGLLALGGAISIRALRKGIR